MNLCNSVHLRFLEFFFVVIVMNKKFLCREALSVHVGAGNCQYCLHLWFPEPHTQGL